MNYNDFYTQSIASGAQPDDFGGIHHTPASIATMQMHAQQQEFINHRLISHDEFMNTGTGQGFWARFFGGR